VELNVWADLLRGGIFIALGGIFLGESILLAWRAGRHATEEVNTHSMRINASFFLLPVFFCLRDFELVVRDYALVVEVREAWGSRPWLSSQPHAA
jgi:hypothetical protein